jgi:hypothetical protein
MDRRSRGGYVAAYWRVREVKLQNICMEQREKLREVEEVVDPSTIESEEGHATEIRVLQEKSTPEENESSEAKTPEA